MMCAYSFFISSVGSDRNEKTWEKIVLAQHSHPHPRHSTCSALASWASSGSVPLGAATIPPIILSVSLCVIHSLCVSISYPVLRVLVRACRQEELHGGGVTVGRGLNESRAAKLCMRGKRMEDGVSERQKRGTRCACAARAWLGVCVHCEEWARSLHM